MTAKFLLDSDICIDTLKRRSNESLMAMVRSIRPEGLAISVITYGEVREGALYSRQPQVDMKRWQQFTGGVDILQVTLAIADVWSELRGLLRSTGKPVGDNDLLIASTALFFQMTLISRNGKHFARIPGLRLLVP